MAKKKSLPALCAWCRKKVLVDGKEIPLSQTGKKESDFVSHGICRECAKALKAELKEPNPPVWAGSSKLWKKAEDLVDKSYKGKKSPDDYYAVVADVYKKLGGKVKRLARGNPSSKEWDAVIEQFRKFHDFMPSQVEVLKLDTLSMPRIVAYLGELEAVTYRSDKWDGKERSYIHHFKKGDRPILATDSEGRRLFVVGGSFRVKAQGITG